MGPLGRPGLVTGLESEASLARTNLSDSYDGLIACEGPGPEAAKRAALELAEQGVGGLISFGYAGGIDREARAGDIVVANEIRMGRSDREICEPIWSDALAATLSRNLTVHRLPIAASTEILETASAKLKMRYTTGAIATDMESLAIARVAREAGLPFITVRAIIDTSDQDLPPLAIAASGEDGRLKPLRILWSLITNPAQISKLSPLTRNSKLADAALRTACEAGGNGFDLPDYRANLIRQISATDDFES